MKLPEPACRYGYTREQVDEIVGDRREEFARFMYGQTGAICDGREYDHGKREHVETGCGPHGMIVYADDLRRFVAGLPVID